MRVLMVSLSMLVLAACGPRKVEVRTGPEPTTDVALHVTNNLSQAVNVYVVSGANDIFLKQVAAVPVWDDDACSTTGRLRVVRWRTAPSRHQPRQIRERKTDGSTHSYRTLT